MKVPCLRQLVWVKPNMGSHLLFWHVNPMKEVLLPAQHAKLNFWCTSLSLIVCVF